MTHFSNTRRLTIEWGHCDPAGIVFNPRYFEFFDWSTAMLLFAASGMNKAEMLAVFGAAGAPVVTTEAKFLKPCRFGDEVAIVSTVLKVGRSSFDVEHRLLNDGALAVEGRETRVWSVADRNGGIRSQPLPEQLAARLKLPAA
jgi:4-hydroxybenzoyl-CoA thioesterase